ncbi:MAG: tRNA(fMet)-specific endonuclease VapC [Candidatus Methanocomedens sp.]|nr:MAG: tRNA(fMet)-specific endonuclease VapC [ANME-2 cluster archaeon]
MYKARFLVDTNIIINYLKGSGNARDFLMKIIDEKASGFFSVITEAELLSGSRNADDESAIYSILDCMEAIEVERNIAVTAGKLRQKYYAAYRTELPDAIIAANANEYELVLATANEKHFNMFKEIEAEYIKEL